MSLRHHHRRTYCIHRIHRCPFRLSRQARLPRHRQRKMRQMPPQRTVFSQGARLHSPLPLPGRSKPRRKARFSPAPARFRRAHLKVRPLLLLSYMTYKRSAARSPLPAAVFLNSAAQSPACVSFVQDTAGYVL